MTCETPRPLAAPQPQSSVVPFLTGVVVTPPPTPSLFLSSTTSLSLSLTAATLLLFLPRSLFPSPFFGSSFLDLSSHPPHLPCHYLLSLTWTSPTLPLFLPQSLIPSSCFGSSFLGLSCHPHSFLVPAFTPVFLFSVSPSFSPFLPHSLAPIQSSAVPLLTGIVTSPTSALFEPIIHYFNHVFPISVSPAFPPFLLHSLAPTQSSVVPFLSCHSSRLPCPSLTSTTSPPSFLLASLLPSLPFPLSLYHFPSIYQEVLGSSFLALSCQPPHLPCPSLTFKLTTVFLISASPVFPLPSFSPPLSIYLLGSLR